MIKNQESKVLEGKSQIKGGVISQPDYLNKIFNIDCLEGLTWMRQFDIVPDLVICDPPYEFEVNGKGLYNQKELMSNIKEIETNSFDFEAFIPKILDVQKDKVNAYFFCNKVLVPKYLNEAIKRNLNFDILALKKNNPIPAKKSSYVPELEYIIFLRSKGVTFNSHYPLNMYKKIFSVNIGHDNLIHPNEKPKELILKFIKVSSNEDDLVLDCFLGSGTTAIASKNLNRNYIGFEISKKYYDICKDRLQQRNLLQVMGE